MIGTVLDKFEVLEKIGEGGMATVYLGRHTTLGRDVAIKVLHPHLSSSTRNRKRFAREARAIEHLRHDNILEIYDYSGTDCSDCYIITEFVDGETLTVLLDRAGRLPSEVTAMIGVSLARALDYAHQRGVLHRDLKPDNVMVRLDGTVKLMDFGIARFLDESQVTMTGALVGSPAFMSPEQAREGDLDTRSDLFSLGTLLFYLVTGHLPFSGSNPSLILKNIIEGNRPMAVELAPTASATLADVIERLLQADREERFNSAQDVVAALHGVLDEAGVDPTEPRWRLVNFREDPDAYRERLEAHLATHLLARGRELLAERDHLAALRLLNRLLAMDEDNAEVLELVQGLHAEARPRRGTAVFALLAVIPAALAAAALLAWGLWGPEDPAVPEPELPLDTEVVLPAPDPLPAELPESEVPAEVATDDPVPAAPPSAAVLPPGPALAQVPLRAAPSEEFGSLEVRVRDGAWADVYVEGNKVGSVRQETPITLPVGTYDVVLKGGPYEVHTLEEVHVDPGAHVKLLDIQLVPLPVTVVIPESFGEDCVLTDNGVDLGRVGDIGFEVARTLQPAPEHVVGLRCPEGLTTWNLDKIEELPFRLEPEP